MVARGIAALAVLLALPAAPTEGQEPSPALFSTSSGSVRFWQTNHLSGGQGGACVVTFTFDGSDLRDPIDGLTLSIRVMTEAGSDLGLAPLSLAEPLGGMSAQRYRDGTFTGPTKWPLQDDGAPNPLCQTGVTLVVETARGRQAGRVVDLVPFRHLTFTTFQRLNVRVRK